MAKSNIIKQLNNYSYEDIYTLMLFTLSELRNVSEYKTLSECAYILDKESLLKFFQYFGGMTIKVPTIDDMQLIINTLLVYQYVNEDGLDFATAVDVVKDNNKMCKISTSAIRDCYATISQVLNKYDFAR